MKTFAGTVMSVHTQKTAHVEVARLWMHPTYRKKVKRTKLFACQDDIGVKPGDEVTIAETRPLSATKHFKILEITKKGSLLLADDVAVIEEKPTRKTVKKTDKAEVAVDEVKTEEPKKKTVKEKKAKVEKTK